MSKNLKTILIGIAIALVFLIGASVSVRNSFVTMNETIDASWAQVENQLQRRYDLIPNLLNTVKGYAAHEARVFSDIAAARAQLAGARSVNQKVAASNQMESAISRLLMVVENYPNLKADSQFARLMDELAGTENRISVERQRYNENIRLFNGAIKLFPKNIIAKFSGFVHRPYLQVEKGVQQPPKVVF